MVFSAPATLTVRISCFLRTVQILVNQPDPPYSEIRPGRRSARDGSPLIEKIEDHDVRVLIFGMGREVAIKRGIGILFTNHDEPSRIFHGRFCWLRFSISQPREKAG